MGPFSVCLLEPIPIIGLKGCARAESYLSSMKSRPRGSARWQVAWLAVGHLSARSVALSMLIVLSVSLLSGCEDAQPTQPTVRVREETTLNSGEAKAAEIQILVPPPIATDNSEQAYVQFPEELHGLWIGYEQSCPTGSEYFDGEFILDISAKEMFGYEEVYRPTNISVTSTSPKSWRIEAMVDIGPSGTAFSDTGPITFILEKGRLKVVMDSVSKTYKKCRLKKNKGA